MSYLEKLPKLELLCLQVHRDIGSGLFGSMQSFEKIKANAEFRLVVECINLAPCKGHSSRLISIDVNLIEAMRRWGWTVTGEFDVKRFEWSSKNEGLIATQSEFSSLYSAG